MIEQKILSLRSAADGTTGRSSQAWLLYLLGGLLVTGGYFLLPSSTAQNILVVLIDLSGVVAIVIGTFMHRPSHPLLWYLFASGTVLIAIADGLWAIYFFHI